MKGFIIAFSLFLASPSFAGQQTLNEDLAQEIVQNCSFMQISYFDIDNEVLEPVEEEASEEACYQSLSKLVQEDREALLNQDQQEWYAEQEEASDFIERPTISEDEEDSGINEVDQNQDVTGRIEVEDNYSDDERPDFN